MARVDAASRSGRTRRRAALLAVRLGERGLSQHHVRMPGRTPGVPLSLRPDWSPERLVAAHLSLAAALSAVLLLASAHLDLLGSATLAVLFAVLTTTLIRRGSGLRRTGADRLGRAVTSWAALTGSVAVVSSASALHVATFVPELLALCAAWLVVLAVWKRVPVVMLLATLLVGPILWGATVWGRTSAGAVVLVVAGYVYARSGRVLPTLFFSVVLHASLVAVVLAHQLTQPGSAVNGADLLTGVATAGVIVAAGVAESWYPDWPTYGLILRRVGTAAALGLSGLATFPGVAGRVVESTDRAALPWITTGVVIVWVIVWVTISNRPVRQGGKASVAVWTGIAIVVLAGLTGALHPAAIQGIGIAVVLGWGIVTIRRGLTAGAARHTAGGFGLLALAVLPTTVGAGNSLAVAIVLFAIAGLGTVLATASTWADVR